MGADRQVKVTVLGDSTSGQRALNTLGDSSDAAGSKLDAFADKFGPKLVAGGASIGAAGVYLTHVADESKKAEAQLRTAIDNSGNAYDDFAPKIKKVSDHLINLGFDDEATVRSLATLTTATQDPAKALDSMGLAADIARARHISLEAASDKLAKAYSGNAKVFKEFGIQIKANATDEEKEAAMAELQSRVHGQAAAQADNFSTKMESLKIRAENVAEAIGAKVGPALTIAGPLMAGFGGILSSGLIPALASGVASAATFAGGMIASGLSAAAAAIPVMIAWAPVIIGVAAIGLAAYELYQHWDQVWGFIKDIAGVAFDWIKDHMELIALVVLAPIAPLILLWQHWDEVWGLIKGIAGAAWDWLRSTISSGVDDVVSFVAGLPGRAVDALSSLGGDIAGVASGAMSSMWDAVSNGAGDIVGFVEGIPGRIVDALGYLGDLLWDAGAAVLRGFLNGLKSVWGDVTGFVGSIGGWIANHKGPIDYDRKLLVPHGLAIMTGLGEGIQTGRRTALAPALTAVTGQIADADTGAIRSPSVDTGGLASMAAASSGAGDGDLHVHIHAGTVVGANAAQDLALMVRDHLIRYGKRVPTLGLS